MGQNFLASVMMFGLVAIVLAAAVCSMSGAITGYTVDLEDGRVFNPQAEAQATRVAMQAWDESRAREIEMQFTQTEADATKDAKPALVARNVMWAMALGVGSLVLVIGCAFAGVAWVSRRATSIYPNAAGQYPVIVRRGFGWITFHDPNRQLSSAAVYRVPTVLDQLSSVITAIQTQRALQLPAPDALFPPTGSEDAMVQIATQAQAGQVAAAQNRWPKLPDFLAGKMSINGRGGMHGVDVPMLPADTLESRVPSITVIDDPARLAEVREQRLECEGW